MACCSRGTLATDCEKLLESKPLCRLEGPWNGRPSDCATGCGTTSWSGLVRKVSMLSPVFWASAFDIDFVNIVLSKYGRGLYKAGRPYSHYSETINAASSLHPKIRRLLQPSWDVAFAWMRNEPLTVTTLLCPGRFCWR